MNCGSWVNSSPRLESFTREPMLLCAHSIGIGKACAILSGRLFDMRKSWNQRVLQCAWRNAAREGVQNQYSGENCRVVKIKQDYSKKLRETRQGKAALSGAAHARAYLLSTDRLRESVFVQRCVSESSPLRTL